MFRWSIGALNTGVLIWAYIPSLKGSEVWAPVSQLLYNGGLVSRPIMGTFRDLV